MKKDDLIELTIEDLGVDGEGIGKVDGMAIFVKDAVPGDRVQAKVMKMKKSYGYARLMQVLDPSPERTESRCAFARQCGGCQLQAMTYEAQLDFKAKKVWNHLIRIGGITDLAKPEIIGMDDPWRYRNKAQFPFGTDKEGNPVTGFYAARSHNIIPCTECWLGVEENKVILEKILDHLKTYHISTYDEVSGKGLLRHVLIRRGFTTDEIMAVLVLGSPVMPSKNNFVKALRKLHPEITTVVLNVNDKRTSMVLGDRETTIYGKGYIEDVLCGLTFRISSKSFYQINPVQTEKLYGKAMELAGLTGKERVIDAYCGIGTIGMVAAKSAKEVIGVELNPDAVRDAIKNAKRNQMKNIRFYQDDAGRFMEKMAAKGEKADVVFMDPPRSGSTEQFMKSAVTLAPQKIVYISCDPQTQARDLKYLTKHGYKAMGAYPYDMFPFTKHAENIVLLVKQN